RHAVLVGCGRDDYQGDAQGREAGYDIGIRLRRDDQEAVESLAPKSRGRLIGVAPGLMKVGHVIIRLVRRPEYAVQQIGAVVVGRHPCRVLVIEWVWKGKEVCVAKRYANGVETLALEPSRRDVGRVGQILGGRDDTL